MPVNPDFLHRYLTQPVTGVTIGGIVYEQNKPPGLELRWQYGRSREEAPAEVRQKTPYQRVFSSNLFVSQAVFLKHFPQRELSGYGHEDTLFAWRLKQHRIPVFHLENPVWHLGLDSAEVFLQKTQQAIHNLVLLHRRYGLGEDTKLFKAYDSLKKWKLVTLLQQNSHWLLPSLKRNLVSSNPSLRLFDLYRLLLLDRYLTE